MVKTIGNPLSWFAHGVTETAGHITHSVERIGGEERVTPHVLPLTTNDIRAALKQGYADFAAVRSDVMFIAMIYPVIGILLVAAGFHTNLMPLVFPVAAGFALLGPLAAVGLYEVSRLTAKLAFGIQKALLGSAVNS